MRFIGTREAPTPGAYSQGVLIDPATHKILFVAGQTANDVTVEQEACVPGGYGPQTTKCLENILAIVEAAGGNVRCLASLEVFLKNPGPLTDPEELARQQKRSREEYNAAYETFFKRWGIEKPVLPVRLQVWVSEIPWEYPTEDTRVEIRAIAAIPRDNC